VRKARQRIGILGAGAWGTAIGKHLAEKGHKVEIWCREPEVAEEINHRHANSRFLIGVELPAGLHALSDPLEAKRRAFAARQRVVTHFSMNAMIAEWESVLQGNPTARLQKLDGARASLFNR